jgi:CHAT domain
MAAINYLDFDLLIERAEGGYRAQVLNSPAGQAATGFALPFSDLELENFFLRVGQTRRAVRRIELPETEATKTFGGRLFNAVFASDVRACLRSSLDEAERQGAGLRVRMRLAGAPELLDLPWEYLYNQTLNRFMALSVETPLVRYLDLPERIQPLAVKPPLKILVMISSPSDYPPLDVEREWAKLTDALRDLTQRGLVSLERLEGATLSALQRRLRQGDYHIFHFVGHGGFDQQAQDGVLLLESGEKRGRPVSGYDLGTLLHDERTLRLAILNACEGARTSRTDPFAGTAQSLVQQGIPAVIGMQFEISDEAAITFSHEFYAAVADGYPVDAALAEARKAIFAQGNVLEWGTPVLYLRAPDGRIFDIERASDAERKQAQVAALLREAQTATAGENWVAAIEKLQSLLALDPSHAEAATRLSQAQQQQKLANLYAMGRRHYDAGRWREALDYFRQTKVAGGGYKDVDTLVAIVQSELAKGEAAPAQPTPSVKKPKGAKRPSASGGINLGWIAGGIGALALLACIVLGGALVLPKILARTPTPVSGAIVPGPTSPTPTWTPTPTPTWTPTPPLTWTPTRTPMPTSTRTPIPTPSRAPTRTPVPTPTRTLVPTPTPTPTRGSYIRVLYPNGGETWQGGKDYTIRWQSQGISGNVKIMLKGAGSGSGGWYTVASSTPNDGSYLYHVPDNLGWEKYKIHVMTLDGSVEDESDGEFTILRP